MKWPALAALMLAGCVESGLSFPEAGSPGPASLQLVPADYYSRTPWMRPRPRQAGEQPKPQSKPEELQSNAPEAMALPEAADELERINERLEELRRRLNKPRGAVEPPQ